MSVRRSLLFSVVMLMALATPVAAAPDPGSASAESVLATHVANCDDIIIAADGTISVNGVALTAAQAALLSADAWAALRLAANARGNVNADVCADVNIGLAPLSIAVNAHIAICGSVVLTADSAAVGGASIPAELLSAGLRQALAVAAAANVNACLTSTVTNGNVVTNVTVDACVQARLNSAGQVVVTVDGQDFVLAGFVIGGTTGALNASVAVTIGLRIGATLALVTDAQTLTVQVVTIAGCAATPTAGGTAPGGTTPGGATTPGGTAPGGTAPSSGSSAAPSLAGAPGGGLLPDTAMEPAAGPLAFLALALTALVLIGLLTALRMGEDGTR